MHILLIPSWYPSKDNQIRGSFFKEQAEALKKTGNKVGVIYPEARILRFTSTYTFKDLGIKSDSINGVVTYRSVFYGKIPGRSYWRERSLWSADAYKLFREYVKSEGFPEIIHVHSVLNGGLTALRIREKYNIPYVITEHSSGFERDLFTKKDKLQIIEIFSESSGNFAVSSFLAEGINRYLFSKFKFKIIPNMVKDIFYSINCQEKKKGKEFIFLSVGALTEGKNHIDLILAFAKAFGKIPEVKLRIAGSGILKNYLGSIIDKEGLENQITMLGRVERDSIIKVFAEADCYVHTSKFETFGVVITEAMASGLPVISSACGGPESVINDENGFLFPVGDVEKLKEQMIYMYENSKQYNSLSISNLCKLSFGESTVIKALENEYRKILDY